MPGVEMKVLTARWLAGGVAAVSVALIAGSLALAFADRHLVSARLGTTITGRLPVPAAMAIVSTGKPLWASDAAGIAVMT